MAKIVLLVVALAASVLAQVPSVASVSGCMDANPSTTFCTTTTPNPLVINGLRFERDATVTIGGRACQNVAWVSNTQLTCTAMGGTGANQIVVVTQSTGTSTETTATVSFADITITNMAGKQADTCNSATVATALRTRLDCPPGNRQPIAGVTVLLPSANSVSTALLRNLLAGTQTLTLNGMGIPAGSAVALAPVNTGCGGAQAAAAQACAADVTGTTCQFTVPPAWIAIQQEIQEAPQLLCLYPGAGRAAAKWTGLAIGIVWDCDTQNADQLCANLPIRREGYESLTDQQRLERRARTVCCKTANNLGVGQCINPNVQSCCGSGSIQNGVERCCNAISEVTTFYNQICPCSAGVPCPVGETCCLATKYPELTTANPIGQCFNPASHQCCNTGQRYDPGSQQCCAINGLQSLDVPCPCGQDSDCTFGGRPTMACCVQSSPRLNEITTRPAATQPMCNAYQNFPSGTGNYQEQRCPGSCIDTEYQICCNGVACIKSFEKCCNSTCCNIFSASCVYGQHAATVGNQFNWNEFRVTYLQCSDIEHLNPLKAFWIFIWPTYLLMMTLSSLALVIVFANKASSRSYSALEIALITFAILSIVFSLSLFFSPIYKYGMVVIFAHLLCILIAGVRVRWLNIVAIFVLLLTVIYLFDPFHGNAYLTLAENRNPDGTIDRDTMGIWHTTFKMWKNQRRVQSERWCTNYYQYFIYDPKMQDLDRFDNPENTTWGYCDRGWVFALLMFEGLIIIFTLINFILSMMAALLRFGQAPSKAVEIPAYYEAPLY